jgi:hypothetical protein
MATPKSTLRGNRNDSSTTAGDVFTVLSNRRRRYSLHYLLQTNDAVDLRELAEQVAAWERGVDVADVSYEQRRNVHTALKQTHLPLMESMNLVERLEDTGSVTLGPAERQFSVYLDVVDRRRTIPWSEFYLGLGVLATLLTALLAAGIPPFDAVGAFIWVAVLSGTLTLSGATHCVHDRRTRLGVEGPPPELQATDDRRRN